MHKITLSLAVSGLAAGLFVAAPSAAQQEPPGTNQATPMPPPSDTDIQDQEETEGSVPLGKEQPPPSALRSSPGLTPAQEDALDVGEAPVPSGAREVLVEIDTPPNLDERGGPDRRQLAIMQTTLLNRFSQLGFASVSEFRREGETYVAEATSRDGEDVTVVIDPMSGTIATRP